MSGDEEAEGGGGKGFVVIDRRGDDDDAEAPSASQVEAPADTAAAPPEGEVPELDFSTLVHSFAISALYHMGAAPPPDGEEAPPVNLALAQQNIDILEILEAKTQGNLSDEETQLLGGVLYEVRMRFVEASKAV